jgi:tetratricopeptide (TPR) repeat protein
LNPNRAMSKLPDSLKRRDILYGQNTPAEVLREYGDLYLHEGKPNDAVEFFGQACYKEGLQRIRQMAIEEGDLFLFSRAAEFLQEEISPEDWRKLGKKALEQGKHLFALKCFEKIGDRAGIEETRKKLGETT